MAATPLSLTAHVLNVEAAPQPANVWLDRLSVSGLLQLVRPCSGVTSYPIRVWVYSHTCSLDRFWLQGEDGASRHVLDTPTRRPNRREHIISHLTTLHHHSRPRLLQTKPKHVRRCLSYLQQPRVDDTSLVPIRWGGTLVRPCKHPWVWTTGRACSPP